MNTSWETIGAKGREEGNKLLLRGGCSYTTNQSLCLCRPTAGKARHKCSFRQKSFVTRAYCGGCTSIYQSKYSSTILIPEHAPVQSTDSRRIPYLLPGMFLHTVAARLNSGLARRNSRLSAFRIVRSRGGHRRLPCSFWVFANQCILH